MEWFNFTGTQLCTSPCPHASSELTTGSALKHNSATVLHPPTPMPTKPTEYKTVDPPHRVHFSYCSKAQHSYGPTVIQQPSKICLITTDISQADSVAQINK